MNAQGPQRAEARAAEVSDSRTEISVVQEGLAFYSLTLPWLVSNVCIICPCITDIR